MENKVGMIEEKMEINLKNILPSLALNLFGNDWRISIRELLQNCNDTNVEAQLKFKDLQNSPLPIRIIPSIQKSTLTIQDEGMGMTLSEVQENLGTIGSGNKKQRLEEIINKHQQSDTERELVKDVIGNYGIGFLSTFIIAEEVVVITKSRTHPEEPAQECVFSGETKWFHREWSGDVKPGTIIILHLKKEYIPLQPGGNLNNSSLTHIDLLNPAILESAIKKFGDFLRYPISICEKLNEIRAPLNSMEAPWEKELESQDDLKHFFSSRFPESNVPSVLETFAFNKAQNNVEAKGIIYFHDSPTFSISMSISNQLFVKRMFIRESFDDILPSWANFVGVILDCPDLTPTLDRNNVILHDQAFINLKFSIRDFIIKKLVEYATQKPEIFNKVLVANLTALQAALIAEFAENEEGKETLFHLLINYIPFRVISSQSLKTQIMTLAKYRSDFSKSLRSQNIATGEHQRDKIYYLNEPTSRAQYETLVIKKNLPAVLAYLNNEYLLIISYAKAFKDEVEVQDVKSIIEIPTKVDQDPWYQLIEFYKSNGPTIVKAASFEPSSMPGVLLVTKKNQSGSEIDDYVERGQNIVSILKRMMEEEFEKTNEKNSEFIFYINAKNPLMQGIQKTVSEEKSISQFATRILEEIYHNCLVFANAAYGLDEHILEHRTNLLNDLLLETKELKRTQTEQTNLIAEVKQFQEFRTKHQDCINVSNVPIKPEDRYCAVLLHDLTKSTWILANIDFAKRGDLFNNYILEMKKIVEKYNGFFDKFTGDGLLAFFGIMEPIKTEDGKKQVCINARNCAAEIVLSTNKFFDKPEIREILEHDGIPTPQCCIALAAGEISFGRYGGLGSGVGMPIVHAARLVAHREFFKGASRVICTEQFITHSKVPYSQVPSLLIEMSFQIDGSFRLNVYNAP